MTILFALPAEPLTSRKPSAPAPPALLMTTRDWSISLFFWMTPWLIRAIWSAPLPVPAGTMNSTVRVGSQASAGRCGQRSHTGQAGQADGLGGCAQRCWHGTPFLLFNAPAVEHR